MHPCPACGQEIDGPYCPKCHPVPAKVWRNKGRVFDVISGGVCAWVGWETARVGAPIIGILLGSAGVYTLVKGFRRGSRTRE